MEKKTLRGITEDLINLKKEKKESNKEYNSQIKDIEAQIENIIKLENQPQLEV